MCSRKHHMLPHTDVNTAWECGALGQRCTSGLPFTLKNPVFLNCASLNLNPSAAFSFQTCWHVPDRLRLAVSLSCCSFLTKGRIPCLDIPHHQLTGLNFPLNVVKDYLLCARAGSSAVFVLTACFLQIPASLCTASPCSEGGKRQQPKCQHSEQERAAVSWKGGRAPGKSVLWAAPSSGSRDKLQIFNVWVWKRWSNPV